MFEDLRQLHELQQQAGAAAGATHWPSSSSWVCREGSPPIFSAGWTHQQVWSYSCGDSYHDTTTAASAASAALPLFHAGLEHLLTSKEALNAQRAFHAEEKIQKAAAAQTSGPAAAGDSPKKHSDSIVHTVNTEVGVTW
eukprot:Tamp_19629.p1 GENE.Tamp_19629~~Tamp_19629.p1  ORF type:complete len:150 (+),score=31.90 Tamp_19629:34-450(+)